MPVVEAHVMQGYDPSAQERLARGLTDAVRLVVPAPDEAITVLIHEVAPSAYMRGGQSRAPAPALPDPIEIVRSYLAAMEARDLSAAQAHLGEGFTMHFPGTVPMHDLAELIGWAQGRYRFVAKTYEGFEALHTGSVAVVYARGALHGEWLDGTPFAGIRFIDRFEIKQGRILLQDVWNDMGEVRPR